MSRRGADVPRIRRRLVRSAAATAIALAVASLTQAELQASRWPAADADPGIVMAPKVASTSTATAVMFSVTAPKGQPPGVVYTVTRVSRRGTKTVCTGPAPLRCTDRVGTPGTPVSYTVSSTLDGRRTATTAVDTTTAPDRTPGPATTGAAGSRSGTDPSAGGEDDARSARGSAHGSAHGTTPPTRETSPSSSVSPSPGTGSPSPEATASLSPSPSPTGSPTAPPTGAPSGTAPTEHGPSTSGTTHPPSTSPTADPTPPNG